MVTISDALLPILKIQVSLRCCFLFSLKLLSHFCRADHLATTFLFLWSKMLLICLLSWRVFLLDTEFRFDDFFCFIALKIVSLYLLNSGFLWEISIIQFVISLHLCCFSPAASKVFKLMFDLQQFDHNVFRCSFLWFILLSVHWSS